MSENPTTPSPEPDAVPAPDVIPAPQPPSPEVPATPDPGPEIPAHPGVPTPDPAAPSGPTPDVTPDPSGPGPITPPVASAAPVDLTPPGDAPDPFYNESGVPSFDAVREKIEGRFATSVGAQELDGESAAGQSFQKQWEAREKAGQDRLEQLRASIRPDNG